MADQDYRDGYGLVHAEPKQKSENGISFLADFIILGGVFVFNQVRDAIYAHVRGGKFRMTPWDDRLGSHDNITGDITIRKTLGLPALRPKRIPKYFLHPRDWSFYFLYRKWFIGRLFSWITYFCLLESCLPQWKWRPWIGKRLWIRLTHKYKEAYDQFLKCEYDFLPKDDPNNGHIKSYDGNEPGWLPGDPKRLTKIRWTYFRRWGRKKEEPVYITKEWAADGKRMNFQRFSSVRLPRTAEACHNYCVKRYGENYGEAFYHIYYRYEDHINVKLAKERRPTYA